MVCGGRTLGPKSAIATASHAKRPRAPVLRHFGRQGLSPTAAAVLLDGVIADVALDRAGLASARDVRLELGLMAAPGPPLEGYYDPRLYEQARR